MKQRIIFSLLITIALIANSKNSNAQQWIDMKYEYDSLLNVVYGTATNFNNGIGTLMMDIYLPTCSDTASTLRHPLMLIIHGGAFIAGTRYDPNINKLVKDFAKRGYVTATIEYRLGFVSDDAAWSCNYPNYACVFATDTAEWIRAAYRGMQDSKGALRYMINRNQLYKIDTNNVFLTGESAGGFIAMAVGYMDTVTEKSADAYAIADAPPPALSAQSCIYNIGKQFTSATIPRPDLGSIDGTIEPTQINYTIKGIGNYYGAATNDMFKYSAFGKLPPALYLYHQPCDLVVPFTVGKVQESFSWCMVNCYNCYSIANTPTVWGSKTIKDTIVTNAYPISVFDDMTANQNPYNCLFGTWSCLDQLTNPCHEIDNYIFRTNNMATYFASLISTSPFCLPASMDETAFENHISVSPNPFIDEIKIENATAAKLKFKIVDMLGHLITEGYLTSGINFIRPKQKPLSRIYLLEIKNDTYSKCYKLNCIQN